MPNERINQMRQSNDPHPRHTNRHAGPLSASERSSRLQSTRCAADGSGRQNRHSIRTLPCRILLPRCRMVLMFDLFVDAVAFCSALSNRESVTFTFFFRSFLPAGELIVLRLCSFYVVDEIGAFSGRGTLKVRLGFLCRGHDRMSWNRICSIDIRCVLVRLIDYLD